ncbi:(2Fe-2S)-binding protein [Saccharibacillus sp. CPCC 101409]|uniref:(2Fe-2S)-binding protein n=1 Tax=Saccharibacillus sp. CPCC 101409 TaxID=3058041 RepID=UPI002671B453|nr:(2Fe-2S)-binding protein [Saccharibacillus sp. CPCC 101409]MDO3412279.1 (2Fe-2S)-binding protein [Saccharibacillus sp. CPCC 101409]
MSEANKIEFGAEALQPQFYMTAEPKPEAELTFTLEELSPPEHAERFLSRYAELLKAPDLQAPVTYFCSWYSGIVSASLYFPAVLGKRPDFSPANLSVQLIPLEKGGSLNFVVGSRMAEPAPQDETEREEWTRAGFRGFFGGTCRPLMENLAAASGLAVGMVWAQLPGRMNYFAESWRNHPQIAPLLAPHRERLERGYELIKNLEAEAFGRKKNPFDIRFRFVEHAIDPKQQIQLRPSCCLYHTIEGGDFCYNCPKLNERERAERRARLRAQ